MTLLFFPRPHPLSMMTIDDVLYSIVQGHEARERLLDFLCLAFRGCAPAERINAWTGGTGKRLMYAIVTRTLGEYDVRFVQPRELLSTSTSNLSRLENDDSFSAEEQGRKMIVSELSDSSFPPLSNLVDLSAFQGVTLVWNVDALENIPEWNEDGHHYDDLQLVRRRTHETRFAEAPPHWEGCALRDCRIAINVLVVTSRSARKKEKVRRSCSSTLVLPSASL